MADTYTYTGSQELFEIAQDKVAVLTLNDPMFTDIMGIRSVNAAMVTWQQRDSFKGLMQPRAPGGPYSKVDREGRNTYRMLPSYYGDQKFMDEEFLTGANQIGTFGTAIDLTTEQGRDQDHLLTRAIQRLKYIGWRFACYGQYSVLDSVGNVVAVDTTGLTPFTTSVAWSNLAASTPILDLRNVKKRHRGHSVSFNKNARLYLNSDDVTNLLSNTNANDLGGRRFLQVAAGRSASAPVSLDDVNAYLLSADLPQIVEWDDTYIDDSGATQLYIQQGYGSLVGARDQGEKVAEFIMTRNAENLIAGMGKEAVGAFENLYYHFELKRNPARGISTMGFNGAPAIYYPSAVIPFRC